MNTELPVLQRHSPSTTGQERLARTVLNGDYCIGCGACAALPESPVSLGADPRGLLVAKVGDAATSPSNESVLKVCPFSSEGPDETELARGLFPDSISHHPATGHYASIYAGRVVDDACFSAGSSGGVGRWILAELLRKDLVDGVIHVGKHHSTDGVQPLYSYAVTDSAEEVLQTAQSAYHPVEMSQALKEIRSQPGRYAITGVPCFIKAIRLLCLEDAVYRQRIRYCVGLICGHLKSKRYAEMIGWQLGVPPSELGRLDFRRKLPGRKANEKGVAAYTRDDPETPRGVDIVQHLYGTEYGLGFFKANACDYCDDVFAETADVVVGDAWLPQYLHQGTSLVLARHPDLTNLIHEGVADGRLDLEPLSVEEAARSQEGGLRHRRDGLRYRLHLKQRAGEWHPPKRVTPSSSHITARYREIFGLRIKIAQESHHAFTAAVENMDFQRFRDRMDPIIAQYRAVYSRGWRRIAKKILAPLGLVPLLRRLRRGIG